MYLPEPDFKNFTFGPVGSSSLFFCGSASIILLVYLLANLPAMEGHWIRYSSSVAPSLASK